MINRRGTPNYHVMAQHVLDISDLWRRPEMLAEQPNGRLRVLAKLIETCFGPDSAEAIARDLMIELDEFDQGDPDEASRKPGPVARLDFMVGLLRNEFDGDAV